MKVHGGCAAVVVAGLLGIAPNAASAAPATLQIQSSFAANGALPAEITCDGAGTPPALSWSTAPSGTRSFAVLVDDPDAPKGDFTHWLVTGIPATATSLGRALPEGAVAAKNDKGSTGYTPPCPPSGKHRYRFHVYALDTTPHATTRAAFTRAIKGHVLAEGELIGTYEKQR